MSKNVYQKLIETNRTRDEDALEELNAFAIAIADVELVASIKFENDDRYLVLPIENSLVKARIEKIEKIQLHEAVSGERHGLKWLQYRSGTYRLDDYRGTMRDVLSKYVTDHPDIFK